MSPGQRAHGTPFARSAGGPEPGPPGAQASVLRPRPAAGAPISYRRRHTRHRARRARLRPGSPGRRPAPSAAARPGESSHRTDMGTRHTAKAGRTTGTDPTPRPGRGGHAGDRPPGSRRALADHRHGHPRSPSWIKAASFIRTRDAFNIFARAFIDVPGFALERAKNWRDVTRHGVRARRAREPRIMIVRAARSGRSPSGAPHSDLPTARGQGPPARPDRRPDPVHGAGSGTSARPRTRSYARHSAGTVRSHRPRRPAARPAPAGAPRAGPSGTAVPARSRSSDSAYEQEKRRLASCTATPSQRMDRRPLRQWIRRSGCQARVDLGVSSKWGNIAG